MNPRGNPSNKQILDSMQRWLDENNGVRPLRDQWNKWPNRGCRSSTIRNRLGGWDMAWQNLIRGSNGPKTESDRDQVVSCALESRRHAFEKTRPELVLALIDRDGFSCLLCGSTSDLTADHIIPMSLGGNDELENLRLLCRSCNSSKGNGGDESRRYTENNMRNMFQTAWVDKSEARAFSNCSSSKYQWLRELLSELSPDGKILRLTCPNRTAMGRIQTAAANWRLLRKKGFLKTPFRTRTQSKLLPDGTYYLYVSLAIEEAQAN